MGPRAIREASTLFAFGHAGAYDHEDDVTYLEPGKTRIVDIGDADIVHTDTIQSHANIEFGVRKMLAAGALPVVVGGDHSINIPCMRVPILTLREINSDRNIFKPNPNSDDILRLNKIISRNRSLKQN